MGIPQLLYNQTRLKGFSPWAPIESFGLGNEWGIFEIFEIFENSESFEISEIFEILIILKLKIFEISWMLSNAKAK